MLTRPIVFAALALTAATTLSACGSGSDNADVAAEGTPSATTSSPSAASGPCTYPAAGSPAAAATAPPATPTITGKTAATIKLSAGEVPVTLNAAVAPCTVNSFLSLAQQGYFDNTPCHRLTTQGIYVLQCGDPSGTGSGGPGYSFADELKGATALKDGSGAKVYAAGTLAMANAGPDTNGSQFFLVYADSVLPPAYSVFGTVSPAGLKVLTGIAKKGTTTGAGDGAPKDAVTITSVAAG